MIGIDGVGHILVGNIETERCRHKLQVVGFLIALMSKNCCRVFRFLFGFVVVALSFYTDMPGSSPGFVFFCLLRTEVVSSF
jgi:hypothetical protein